MPQLIQGNYYGIITEAGLDTSNSGTPCMAVVFNVTHRANGEAWAEMEHATRTVRCYLSDKALPFSKERLDSLGFNGDFDNPVFSEKGAPLVCKHDKHEGKVHEKWDLSGNGAGNYERKAPSSEIIMQLQAKWNALGGGAPQSPPNTPPESAPQAAPVAAESPAATSTAVAPVGEDIPF